MKSFLPRKDRVWKSEIRTQNLELRSLTVLSVLRNDLLVYVVYHTFIHDPNTTSGLTGLLLHSLRVPDSCPLHQQQQQIIAPCGFIPRERQLTEACSTNGRYLINVRMITYYTTIYIDRTEEHLSSCSYMNKSFESAGECPDP